jgi:hypothetical protein
MSYHMPQGRHVGYNPSDREAETLMWQQGSYLAPTQDSGIHSGVPSQTPSLVGRDQAGDDDEGAEDGLLFDMDHSTFTNSFTQGEVDGKICCFCPSG